VLLIDKKPFYLTLEDMRYDMISDVEFNHRLLDATIRLGAIHKTLTFTAFNHGRLRLMTTFVQQQVMAARQQAAQMTFTQQQPAVQPQEQPANTGQALGQSAIQGLLSPNISPINPYNMPVMIRRRVSRFY
jgi:hypothetical protein